MFDRDRKEKQKIFYYSNNIFIVWLFRNVDLKYVYFLICLSLGSFDILFDIFTLVFSYYFIPKLWTLLCSLSSLKGVRYSYLHSCVYYRLYNTFARLTWVTIFWNPLSNLQGKDTYIYIIFIHSSLSAHRSSKVNSLILKHSRYFSRNFLKVIFGVTNNNSNNAYKRSRIRFKLPPLVYCKTARCFIIFA